MKAAGTLTLSDPMFGSTKLEIFDAPWWRADRWARFVILRARGRAGAVELNSTGEKCVVRVVAVEDTRKERPRCEPGSH